MQKITRHLVLVGIVAGLIACWVVPDSYITDDGTTVILKHSARITAGVAVTMAIWWMTEAIPVYATALLPIAVLPISGAYSMQETVVPYSNKLIFLFLGGFILALAMQKCGLHRRLALNTLKLTGTRPRNIIGGFMFITAALSMWVSNTATTMMMLPIASSLISLLAESEGKGIGAKSCEPNGRAVANPFATGLLLAIAYAASIGGLGTMIGSPPNALAVSFLEDSGITISFVDWMKVGVPTVLILLPICWGLLVFFLFPVSNQPSSKGQALFEVELEKLGKTSVDEWLVLTIFLTTAFAWIARPWLQTIEVLGSKPLANLGDTGIVMVSALLLFAIPSFSDRSSGESDFPRRLMTWDLMKDLPWGVLLLFGGGLSLAAAIKNSGLSQLMATQFKVLAGSPEWLIVFAIIVFVIFLTEVTSNTATVATLLPLLAALAASLSIDVIMLAIPAALAASCAFMLPVATPPNAIVYSSGKVSIAQMCRAGLWLNIFGAVALLIITMSIAGPIFGRNH